MSPETRNLGHRDDVGSARSTTGICAVDLRILYIHSVNVYNMFYYSLFTLSFHTGRKVMSKAVSIFIASVFKRCISRSIARCPRDHSLRCRTRWWANSVNRVNRVNTASCVGLDANSLAKSASKFG